VIFQYALNGLEIKKDEVIAKLLQAISIENIVDLYGKCFSLLKDHWIAPLISNRSGDLINEMVGVFSSVHDSPDLFLEFIKVILEDPAIGREFRKMTEQLVDGQMEELLEASSNKSDIKTNGLIQTLIVFCHGRYEELLSPHLSVIVFYAFDSKLPQTTASASKLLRLIAGSGGSLSQLRQQPRIIEKLTKAIISGPEGNISFHLGVLHELDQIGSKEVSKMASKFHDFLGNKSEFSRSAINRALFVVGLATNYLDNELGLSILSKIVDKHNFENDSTVLEYSRLAFSFLLPKLISTMELQSDILSLLNASLESENKRVQEALLDSLIKILETIETENSPDSDTREKAFNPNAYNSVSKLVQNFQYIINELIEKISSVALSYANGTQFRMVKIFKFLIGSGVINPQLLIPHLIAYAFGTKANVYSILETAIEKYGSLFAGCFQKAFSLAFQLLTNSLKEDSELEFPGDQMLDYLMHTKNKWKEIIGACLSLAFKSKDMKFTKWLLNYLLYAGQSSLAEQDFLLKQVTGHILQMTEIYFEELEAGESVDPLVVHKLVYYLQFSAIIKDQMIVIDDGENKTRPKKLTSSVKSAIFVQEIGNLAQMQTFIESKSIPYNSTESNIPLKSKKISGKKSQRSKRRRAITMASYSEDSDDQDDPDDPIFS
jgi:hypothetical protein